MVQAEACHDRQTDTDGAGEDQRRAETPYAPADPTTGTLVGKRGERPHSLLRSPRQHPGGRCFPQTGDPALAQDATAPQPAHHDHLGTDEPTRDPMAPESPRHAPIPERAA